MCLPCNRKKKQRNDEKHCSGFCKMLLDDGYLLFIFLMLTLQRVVIQHGEGSREKETDSVTGPI